MKEAPSTSLHFIALKQLKHLQPLAYPPSSLRHTIPRDEQEAQALLLGIDPSNQASYA